MRKRKILAKINACLIVLTMLIALIPQAALALPDAPVLETAETTTDGTKIILTFDKDMMASPPAAPAGFTVSAGGNNDAVTGVARGSNTNILELTLTTPVLYRQSATVSYTPGSITSADGGILAAFSNISCANFVPLPSQVNSAFTSSDGGKIIVAFNVDMMASPPAAPAGFTVSVAGNNDAVTGVARGADTKTLELTLATPVIGGENITVSYIPGSIVDTNGNSLTGFTNLNVSNSAPVISLGLTGASTSTDGSKVILAFTVDMMANSPGAPAGFTVSVDGNNDTVTSVLRGSTDPKTLELTLTRPVVCAQTITVSYTPGSVTDASGRTLAGFANQAVTDQAPSSAAPQLFEAVATNTGGSKIILIFNRNMMASPPAAPAGFTVSVNGDNDVVTGVTRGTNTTTLELTLATPVGPGQTVTVSYSQGGITATDGNSLADFSNYSVTAFATLNGAHTSADGCKLILSFDYPMMANPPSGAAGFTVSAGGNNDAVTGVARGSNACTLELTLSTPVLYGQSVTVSYTPGSIISAYDGVLDAFSNQAVTNNVPAPPTPIAAYTSDDGSKIILGFSKAMMPSPPAGAAGFTVSAGGSDDAVTAVTRESVITFLDLTLATPVQNGQTVTVSYTPGSITADDGTILAVFAGISVDNRVPPQVAPPLILSLDTSTDGSKIILTFDKAMMASPPAGAAGFTASAGGNDDAVTGVARGSNTSTLELTLTTPVLNGQEVTASYTPGSITSADGGILAGFSNRAVTNKVPASAAPTLSSAATSADGHKIILTFDKTMMASPPQAPAGFSVSVDGHDDAVTAVTRDNLLAPSTMYLTLTTPVLRGQTVTVSYTPGSITAADGGILAAFSDENVTNYALPPGSAPILSSAATKKDGSVVILTFNMDMASPPAGAAGFTVSVDGHDDAVTAVTRESIISNLELSLTTPVLHGQTVTVSYTPGGITAADGGILAAYSDQAVTNNVPAQGNVTYDGNGNTGGNVPIDNNTYAQGDTVTVLGNTGNLVKTGCTFAGWNTQADGKGTGYQPGATLTMGTANVTLYAQWTTNAQVTHTVSVRANPPSGGSVNGGGKYAEGDPVTVQASVYSGYNFVNWTENNIQVSTSAALTFTMGPADRSLVANFSAIPNNPSGGGGGGSYTPAPASGTVTGSVIDGATGAQVASLTAIVTTDSNGNETISLQAAQVVLLKQPDRSAAPLSDLSKAAIVNADGSLVTISSDGTIQIPNLAKGTDNHFNITCDLGNGQKITIGTLEINIDGSGKVSLTMTLIDPYGIISDAPTGEALAGVKVTLYYAGTDRNKTAGKTPDTVVALPGIDGFKPNNNANPQVSDASGAYGFLVFPTTDYYIVATKDGYEDYKSPTISVEQVIVKWDFKMNQATAGVKRLSGLTRVDTALEIAKAIYTGKVANVILATADNYPDALAGSVLAYKVNAPILLVSSSDTDQEKILAYLKSSLDPLGTVYILGGTGAVSSAMETKVKDSGFPNITRIAGTDRYETALKIADSLGVKTGTPIVLAYGEDYPDALSISSTAAVLQSPILLGQKDGISEAVKQKIAEIKPTKVYFIGLEGVLSAAVEAQVAQITGLDKANIVRIGGADRYETSLAVAQYFNLGGRTVCIATGNDFPDALAGSILAANSNAPVILVDQTLSDEQMTYLKAKKIAGATIFGGKGAVSDNIGQQISQLLGK